MGVEYRHFLIPRPNTFRPTPLAALLLVEALRNDGWLLDPGSPALSQLPFSQSSLYKPAKGHGYFARTVGNPGSFAASLSDLFNNFANRDLMVVWPIESLTISGVRYPLEPLPFDNPADASDCYYEFEVHFGHDFIYHTSEIIWPFDPPPTCPRGHSLQYDPESEEDPFYAYRLAVHCSKCGWPFDPTQLVATGRDGWTGAAHRVKGGTTYRFALVVDCGKFFGNHRYRFHPQLKALIERTLGIATYEVPDFY